jgi:hypothetical protein
MSTGGAAMNAMMNTVAAVKRVGIIKTPNQPMYKRFSVLVTHSQKRAQRLVLSRLSKIAVIIKTFFVFSYKKEFFPKSDVSNLLNKLYQTDSQDTNKFNNVIKLNKSATYLAAWHRPYNYLLWRVKRLVAIISFCDILPLLGLPPSKHHVLWKRKASPRKIKYLELGSLEIFSGKDSILSGKQNYRFIIKAGFGVPGHKNPPRCGAK